MNRLINRLLIALLCITLPTRGASLQTIPKTPFEEFNVAIDFSPVAGPCSTVGCPSYGSDGITLIGVVSTSVQTGTDTTSTIIAASPAPSVVGSTDVVTFRVQGGSTNQTHLVGVRVRDNVTGEIFEGQITVAINSGLR